MKSTTYTPKPYRSFAEWAFQQKIQLGITKTNCESILGYPLYQVNAWQSNKTVPTTRTIFQIVKSLSRHTGHSKEDVFMSIIDSLPEWRKIR